MVADHAVLAPAWRGCRIPPAVARDSLVKKLGMPAAQMQPEFMETAKWQIDRTCRDGCRRDEIGIPKTARRTAAVAWTSRCPGGRPTQQPMRSTR